jgi:hypothetical protein
VTYVFQPSDHARGVAWVNGNERDRTYSGPEVLEVSVSRLFLAVSIEFGPRIPPLAITETWDLDRLVIPSVSTSLSIRRVDTPSR